MSFIYLAPVGPGSGVLGGQGPPGVFTGNVSSIHGKGAGPAPSLRCQHCFHPGMAVNSVFLFCSAFVLFDVRGLFVFKRSEVGFCSVVLFGPLALFGNSAGLFCFCSAEVWKTFLFCERRSVPSLPQAPGSRSAGRDLLQQDFGVGGPRHPPPIRPWLWSPTQLGYSHSQSQVEIPRQSRF